MVDYTKDNMQEKKQQKGYGQVLARFEPEEQTDFGAYADTMSEIIIQYGYVPIAPLFPLINNTFEMKVEVYNLIRQSQRPHPNGSSGSGAWHAILGFFSIVVVATNVELLTWPTSVVEYLTSLAGDSISNNYEYIEDFRFDFKSFTPTVLLKIDSGDGNGGILFCATSVPNINDYKQHYYLGIDIGDNYMLLGRMNYG